MHSCRSSRWSLTSSLPRHSTGVSTDTKHGRSGGSGCVGRRRLYGDPALHHAPSEWRASSDEHYCRVTLVAPRACAGRTGTKTAWWDRHASPRCATPIDLRMILSRGGCSSRRRRRRRRVAAGPRRLVPREGHHVEQHQQRDARPRRPVAAAGPWRRGCESSWGQR
eukprot:COSAG06_NODE_3565_length_5178_cov_5.446151_2_plen_166_part_00